MFHLENVWQCKMRMDLTQKPSYLGKWWEFSWGIELQEKWCNSFPSNPGVNSSLSAPAMENLPRQIQPKGILLSLLIFQFVTSQAVTSHFAKQREFSCILCNSFGMNSMKLVIPLHFISLKKDSKRCSDTSTLESIHTKDESKHGSAFAFIFGVNWPVQLM